LSDFLSLSAGAATFGFTLSDMYLRPAFDVLIQALNQYWTPETSSVPRIIAVVVARFLVALVEEHAFISDCRIPCRVVLSVSVGAV
jgi:hypothetical protein